MRPNRKLNIKPLNKMKHPMKPTTMPALCAIGTALSLLIASAAPAIGVFGEYTSASVMAESPEKSIELCFDKIS
jgi:hypothetical protein